MFALWEWGRGEIVANYVHRLPIIKEKRKRALRLIVLNIHKKKTNQKSHFLRDE